MPADLAKPPRVTKREREVLNGHREGVILMTGLSGACKSTIAALLEFRLHAMDVRTCVLDGDVLRGGFSRDLGFSDRDRIENVRRVTEAARLMVDAGLVVIAALISPFRIDRQTARDRFAPGEIMKVFVDAPLAVCQQRDPKGLYKRARRGEILAFAGNGSRYESPVRPDSHIDSASSTPQQIADALLAAITKSGLIKSMHSDCLD